jgi:hypothetical protein
MDNRINGFNEIMESNKKEAQKIIRKIVWNNPQRIYSLAP